MALEPLSEETYEKIKILRNSLPGFARSLGIRLTHLAHGEAVVELAVEREELRNTTGTTIHGGVIFTVADTAAGAAACSGGFYAATASAELHYVNPALDSKLLRATAATVKFGKRLYVFDVEVRNEANTLIAKGLFSYMPLDRPVLEE